MYKITIKYIDGKDENQAIDSDEISCSTLTSVINFINEIEKQFEIIEMNLTKEYK